jgi:hypothetical protein
MVEDTLVQVDEPAEEQVTNDDIIFVGEMVAPERRGRRRRGECKMTTTSMSSKEC